MIHSSLLKEFITGTRLGLKVMKIKGSSTSAGMVQRRNQLLRSEVGVEQSFQRRFLVKEAFQDLPEQRHRIRKVPGAC